MATPFEKFTSVLKELFMLDQADLDFGIYRIINQKRKEIERFLNEDLKKQVQALLKENDNSDVAAWQSELKKLVSTLKDAGMNPDESPKVQELKDKLANNASASVMEGEVYSHLATFFNRYYDNGDFLSNRRYKKDVYAIPYEGEEVKLHWANADQYYIKTSENFQNYSFKTADDKTIHFRLRDASTEMNNNKMQANQERRFAIAIEDIFEVNGDELSIFFTYEPKSKSVKQKELTEEAISVIKDELQTQELLEPYKMGLLTLAATEKNKDRTILEKHLTDYVSKNSFDYFIHKDLGGFLRRELDFYIKNEVLFIDDISSRSPEEFVAYLTQMKTIKAVGDKLITFLAQLEDFQKKLWLKKKFVVETNYCITLDRVPEELYKDIIANDAQREEWVRLFAIDEIKGSGNKKDIFDTGTSGYSIPLTSDFLKENPFLVLDTAFFDDSFKHRLLSSIDNFEEKLDGTLINSDNFQALSILEEKYLEQIKCIYIDPPYNTGSDGFLYKDGYQSSSWCSLIDSTTRIAKRLLSNNSLFFISNDDHENDKLKNIIFNNQLCFKTNLIWNTDGHTDNQFEVKINHEYITLVQKTINAHYGNIIDPNTRAESNLWDNIAENSITKNGPANPYSKVKLPIGFPVKDFEGEIEKDLPIEDYFLELKSFNYYPRNLNKKYNVTFPIKYNSAKYSNYKLDECLIVSAGWANLNKLQKFIDNNCIPFDDKDGLLEFYLSQKGTIYYRKTKSSSRNIVSVLRNFTTTEKMKYELEDMGIEFRYPKPKDLIEYLLKIGDSDIYLDYFAGSGTTGHSIINLNRQSTTVKKKKFILIEMGAYFDLVTKPRIEKVIYSKDWKNGKPVSREGSSHCFKYLRLEQYEDTLNNLIIQKPNNIFDDSEQFQEGYLLSYMMDIETRGSLFNLKWFVNPFDVKMKITKQNELKETRIDLVETFNYLIGLNVYNTSYPKAGLCVVEGTTRTGEKSLVIWRDCETIDNQALNEFFTKSAYSTLDHEYDRIYVNGDNLLQNIRKDEDHWKVVLIEEEFSKRMFEA